MQEIRNIAKEVGVKASRLNKVDLVRQIQLAEGNNECFASANSENCDQTGCLWRDDCFSARK